MLIPMSTDFSSHGKDMKAVVVLTELSDLGWWHRIGMTARLFGCWLLASLAAFAQIRFRGRLDQTICAGRDPHEYPARPGRRNRFEQR